MSWPEYVNNMTIQGAQQCGIYTKQGAQCAQSSNFNVSTSEVLALKQCMEGAGGEVKIEINGQPCTMISFDKEDGTVQAKTKNPIMQDSKVFYHIESTNQYVIVCGKTGAGERGACKISHEISAYLKGLGH